MDLSRALRLDDTPCLALVGAGGKSTALFQLAHQLTPPVLITATTHLATYQISWADQHITLGGPEEVDSLEVQLPSSVTLLTGPLEGKNRTAGLNRITLDQVYRIAERRAVPLLVEADGSRQKPLKSPGPHEPPIPEFVETLVVVAGLLGLGKPLSADWVHRPDVFAKLSGLDLGDTVSPEALSRVLNHPQGGLKNVPELARRIVLLNQADTQGLQAQAKGIASQLLAKYHAVVIGALNPLGMVDESFPQISSARIHSVHEPVAGVVLAAGSASRFGEPKQLLPWRGKPLIRHVVESGLEAGLEPLVVVTGEADAEIRSVLEDLPVVIIHNSLWREGQSASLHKGLDGVQDYVGGVVFLLADQPQIPAPLIRSLVEEHARNLSPVVAPLVDGQRANPVLFDQLTFPDLKALRGDVGGRGIFSKYSPTWVPWQDPRPLMDVDTLEDYERLLSED